MSEIEALAAAGVGLLATIVGAVRVGVRIRGRVQLERERAARSIAWSAALERMVRHSRRLVRVIEEDGDGRRVVEIGRRHAGEEE